MIENNPEVKIVEVGPRDGLQNEKTFVATDIKIELINRLMACGLSTIEATSLVSPKWVPQMADQMEVIKALPKTDKHYFPVLVPNRHGLENAIAQQIKDIAIFAAATETFSQKNINRSIEESLQQYCAITRDAIAAGIRVRGYVSCALGCPYEGKVAPSQVMKVAKALYDAGCIEISLADTIGVGTPFASIQLIKAAASEIPVSKLAVHYHDTYGQALANIFACLDLGIRIIDSSVAGIGGCPYAKGATGNVATEDVVYMLDGIGMKTGIDLDKLVSTSEFICKHLNIPIRSKVAVALLAKRS